MNVTSVAPGTSARFGPRLLASLIDWCICLLIPFILAGLFVSVLWLVIVPLSVVAYFAFFLSGGRTPGMRAASLREVDRRTGRAPSVGKALARSLVALLQAVAFFALFNLAFSDTPSGGYSAADFAVLAASVLVASSSLVGHLWMFLDRERRTLLDRFFGLAVESSLVRR
jgi:uncharacterized RDD family membrane protein YckC